MSEFSLEQVKEGAESAVQATREFLGVSFEQFVCPDCNVPCVESETYDIHRAADFQGEAPSWYCESCDSHFVREMDEAESLSGDMYGRE